MWQPVLRGAKIILFLLGIALSSLIIIAIESRPTKAENFILNVSCFVGIAGDQDCDPPTTPVLVAPGGFVPGNSFAFSWEPVSDESAVTYKVCVSGSSSGCIDKITGTSLAAADLIKNEAGTWQWGVVATDEFGHVSQPSEMRSFTLDTVDPEVNLSASAVLVGGNTASSTITGKVSDAHLATYKLSVVDPASGVTILHEESNVSVTSTELSHIFEVMTKPLASGTYVFKLSAFDKSGRVVEQTVAVEVDTDGPALSVTGGDTIIKSGSIRPTVSAEDVHGEVTYIWSADAKNADALSFNATEKDPLFTPTKEGSYTFRVETSDSLGNVTSGVFHFDYRRDLPLLPLPTDPNTSGTDPNTVNPSLPAVVSPGANATNRATSEETFAAGASPAEVLGSVVSGGGDPLASAKIAALTPTQNGWSILGVLWYWWLVVIVGVFAAALFVRRRFGARMGGE